MNGLTAENVERIVIGLKIGIREAVFANSSIAAKELADVLSLIEAMQRNNTAQASRPDRVGDECWYAASNDPYKRGVLRAWLGGQYEGHAVAVEDVETNAIRYVDYISFSTEAPK
jgi:hypothetical protein